MFFPCHFAFESNIFYISPSLSLQSLCDVRNPTSRLLQQNVVFWKLVYSHDMTPLILKTIYILWCADYRTMRCTHMPWNACESSGTFCVFIVYTTYKAGRDGVTVKATVWVPGATVILWPIISLNKHIAFALVIFQTLWGVHHLGFLCELLWNEIIIEIFPNLLSHKTLSSFKEL